jgi:hypothetical protein
MDARGMPGLPGKTADAGQMQTANPTRNSMPPAHHAMPKKCGVRPTVRAVALIGFRHSSQRPDGRARRIRLPAEGDASLPSSFLLGPATPRRQWSRQRP